METRASFALIGATIVAGLVAFLGFVLWLGQVQFNRDYAEYNVEFHGAVNGLSEGGQVRYLGINVGEVTDLSLDPQSPDLVIARIRIDAETPVRADSKAILDFAGLTGVTFIQIRPGTEGAPLMPKRTGSGLPVIETERTQLAEIFEGGQDLIANAQVTLARLNSVFTDENVESLTATLNNLETVTGAFAEDEKLLSDAAESLAAIKRAGDSISDAAGALGNLGTDAQTYLGDLMGDAKQLFADASRAVNRAEAAIDQSEKAVETTRTAIERPAVEAVDEVRLMAQELRLLIRRLDRIAREVEQNPQAFVQGTPKPYRDE